MKRPNKETLRHIIRKLNKQSEHEKLAEAATALRDIKKGCCCRIIEFSFDKSSHPPLFLTKNTPGAYHLQNDTPTYFLNTTYSFI